MGGYATNHTRPQVRGSGETPNVPIQGIGTTPGKSTARTSFWLWIERIPEATIQTLLAVGRTAIWRTRSAYCERGLNVPFTTWLARERRPIIKPTRKPKWPPWLVPSHRPGAKRWTVRLLTQFARKESGMKKINREPSAVF